VGLKTVELCTADISVRAVFFLLFKKDPPYAQYPTGVIVLQVLVYISSRGLPNPSQMLFPSSYNSWDLVCGVHQVQR
jgi:hypothetical protein